MKKNTQSFHARFCREDTKAVGFIEKKTNKKNPKNKT